MRRISIFLLALLTASLVYSGLVYLFVTRIWPLLPLWANAIVAVILALSVILAPFMWLLRLGEMKTHNPPPPD
jgi:hypothetical protein